MGSGEGFTIGNFILCTIYLIVRVSKFRRLKRAGHVARTEEDKSAIKILIGKPTGKRPSGRLGGNGRKILEWVLKELV